MSTTAEDVSSTLSSAKPGESSDDKADAIAELLVGGESESESEDEKEEETLDQSSNQDEDEESNEESEADDSEEDETTLEAVAEEGDVTWETVLGVSEDKLSFDEAGNIVGFKTKVNGEEEIVKTEDLVAGFQNNKHFTQKSQALAEEIKTFEVQKEQVEQTYASKLESVDALSEYFEKQLISEYDNVNWDHLRTADPAEYAAMRSDYATKASELQNIRTAIADDKESASAESLKANQAKAGTYMKEQFDQMLINNPEWSDEKVRMEAKDGYQKFVKDTYGFKDQEFDSVFDARLIELIKDAKKYRDGASVAAKKIAKPVPKFQKSRGGGTKPKVSKLEKLTAASRKAVGSNKRELQQSAVAELLLGG